mmetsp:Transcript_118643/g.232964  ORF Transcript_118643/g.232964 Transcript_118643/m.232964 type:complete len:85 (+) Transcript_118643:2422-2676(+)
MLMHIPMHMYIHKRQGDSTGAQTNKIKCYEHLSAPPHTRPEHMYCISVELNVIFKHCLYVHTCSLKKKKSKIENESGRSRNNEK